MKIKLIRKLQEDRRNLVWFWEGYIKEKCDIKYPTFMNQLSGIGTLREDVEKVILEFIDPGTTTEAK